MFLIEHGPVAGLFRFMGDALSNADPLDGVCGIVACGETSCIVAHTLTGLASDADGSQVDHNGVGILRIDPRLSGDSHTRASVHEWVHHRHKHWTEEAVKEYADQLTAYLHLPEIKRRSFS